MNSTSKMMNALFLQNQKGAAMRSFIHIRAKYQLCGAPDGSYKAEFNVLALIFDDNGVVKESVDREETVSLKGRRLSRGQHQGARLFVECPDCYRRPVPDEDRHSG